MEDVPLPLFLVASLLALIVGMLAYALLAAGLVAMGALVAVGGYGCLAVVVLRVS